MSRWICIDDICIPSDENDWEELVAFADAIAEQESIDIVRCRECKYWHSNTQFCDKWSHGGFISQRTLLNDFCSCGEREGE